MAMKAKEILDLLGLVPHPTCGFVTETYRSHKIPKKSLPAMFDGDRPLGSVLYFMMTPEAQIRLHRICSDQMYHHYMGDPLEVLMLFPGGSGAVKVIGPDLSAGMRPQLFIPNTFHISRLVAKQTGFSLLGTTEWPGVEPPDVELGDPDRLAKSYPHFRKQIKEFVQSHVSAQTKRKGGRP